MQKKKVLHITGVPGGVKTYIENIMEYSDREQFEYYLIAPVHKEFEKFCSDRSIPYFRVKFVRNVNLISDLISFVKVIRVILKVKPDVVHTHSAKGGIIGRIAAKFCSKKVIHTPNAFSYLSFTGFKRLIFIMIECLAKPITNVLLAVSHSEANRAHGEIGFAPEKIVTVLNAIPIKNRVVQTDYTSAVNIGMIARLTHQKNPLLYLRLAKSITQKYPGTVFTILGGGVLDLLEKDIYAYMEANNLMDKVKILSWGDVCTTDSFFRSTDIYVMTSAFEGLSFALLEAMQYGLPCVVSDVDGNTDTIQNHENGFVCMTYEQFHEKLALLINDEATRRRIGEAGFRCVEEHFDITKNIKLIENLYATL